MHNTTLQNTIRRATSIHIFWLRLILYRFCFWPRRCGTRARRGRRILSKASTQQSNKNTFYNTQYIVLHCDRRACLCSLGSGEVERSNGRRRARGRGRRAATQRVLRCDPSLSSSLSPSSPPKYAIPLSFVHCTAQLPHALPLSENESPRDRLFGGCLGASCGRVLRPLRCRLQRQFEMESADERG